MKYRATVNHHRSACEMLQFLQASSPSWHELYQQQSQEKQRYFTSFEFITSWLLRWPVDVGVSSSFLYKNENCVGVTFFTQTKNTRLGVLKTKTLHLCRSGVEEIDKIWPEYIEPVLAVSSQERNEVWAYWLEEIMSQTGAHQMYQHVAPLDSLMSAAKHVSRSRCIIENREEGPVRFLSEHKKAASSLRRKMSQTSRRLDLTSASMKLAKNEEDVLRVFQKIKEWHLDKWSGTDTPSGFENTLFASTLKKELLSSLYRDGSQARARCYYIEHDGSIIGGTVLLEENSWAGFYLAGYQPFNDNHIHLGLWMHVQLIEILSSRGMLQYDFMAGGDSYKSIFSNRNVSHARARWVKRSTIYSYLLLSKEIAQKFFMNRNSSDNITKVKSKKEIV
ncbi:hypothetical protein BM525_21275 (plasmid) [Alteromonas mediterranea]|uniref:BioF2-like acetyltransferase domain-containing protein n=1 Tax=Alteromonas mediterranea TaxID=314275 RepID=A0AAC9JHS3_9ALTE|nr:GNAT family N-acetyltransferase [Alteromonas mediterranea]APD92392.1 hypothetical protein BM524_21055 [Alteromonas mediterranea]APE00253.1 hypothetical protein BM525_21275 [Alteromonas mediterranea]